ncbi:MAG: hypothetical protein LBE62_03475 [Azonexus sp.]|jgi:hypothetical protein|nr:hypothetical protein [Azonexus sp.]
MTPATIIKQATTEGVNLVLLSIDRLNVTGDGEAVNRWLPMLREHKAGIIAALSSANMGAAQPATPDPAAVECRTSLPTVPADYDDRRTCQQCAELSHVGHGGYCMARLRRWGRRSPCKQDLLQRCRDYKPTADDPDQRPGRTRWPCL